MIRRGAILDGPQDLPLTQRESLRPTRILRPRGGVRRPSIRPRPRRTGIIESAVQEFRQTQPRGPGASASTVRRGSPKIMPATDPPMKWGAPSSSRMVATRRTASNSSGSCAFIGNQPAISLGCKSRPEPEIGQSQGPARQIGRDDHPALFRRGSEPPQVDQHALGFGGGILGFSPNHCTASGVCSAIPPSAGAPGRNGMEGVAPSLEATNQLAAPARSSPHQGS